MSLKSKNIILSVIAILLTLILFGFFIIEKIYDKEPRAVVLEMENQDLDFQKVLQEFEDSKMEESDTEIAFEGFQTLDLSQYELIDNVSNVQQNKKECKIKYSFYYNRDTNIVTLSAEMHNEYGDILVDTIEGYAFTNSNGEIDAVMNLDGEDVLLSQMQEAGMIQNCGWFTNLFTKIVVAVVVVVAVAAVASAVVATAGAGMGAVIAAGAIAGSISGGVAGGIISVSEYGKLDWRWVVGGAVIGGALGAVTGWGVGSAMHVSQSSQVTQFIKAAQNGTIKRTKTVNAYYTSGQRNYINSNQLVSEIMKSKKPIIDAADHGLYKWTVEGVNGTSKGIWELYIEPTTKTIYHFLWKSL